MTESQPAPKRTRTPKSETPAAEAAQPAAATPSPATAPQPLVEPQSTAPTAAPVAESPTTASAAAPATASPPAAAPTAPQHAATQPHPDPAATRSDPDDAVAAPQPDPDDAVAAPQPDPDDAVVEAEIVEEPARPSATEPVVPTTRPDAVVTDAAPAHPQSQQSRVVYVTTPAPPRKLGNRGLGSLLAVISAVVFLALLALVFALVGLPFGGLSFAFLASSTFYIPALFYVIGAVLLVLLVNRAGWAAHVFGSLLVGLFVYFGTAGLLTLTGGAVTMTPQDASALFVSGLTNPFVAASGLLAREVALWSGALIARRGRSLKERNARARSEWDVEVARKREDAERMAGYGL